MHIKASNGVVVESTPSGSIRIQLNPDGNRLVLGAEHYEFSQIVPDALREFFRAEEDKRLGRWRWPENPSYVVYTSPSDDQQGMFGSDIDLLVMRETDGWCKGYARVDDRGGPPASHRLHHVLAARAYFDAHPEPKPMPSEPHTAWVDKYGTDIWVVNGLGVLRCVSSPSSDPAKYAPFTRLVREDAS